ncbi:MAG: SDR family oxidoreductase [Verrucomicrobia bacterium]|nr:SDR family oxidoreductase [Verrucomicrobiota bacterium]
MNSSAEKKPKVVAITGASAGVGRAAARAFARKGAKIGLIARGDDGLQAARRDVEVAGGQALVLPLDVADAAAVDRAAASIEEHFGPIDVWVNDAMTSVFAPFHEISPDEFRRVTEVTYLGFVYGTMAALKRMRPRNRGVIIQVGSALAVRSIPLQSAYCGAKHGIVGFTDSVRCELLHEGSDVRITVVQMPALNTPQFGWVLNRLPHKTQPVPPIYEPEVAAEAIVWAAEHPRRELWVGRATYEAILGQRVAPSLLDRRLARSGYASQQTPEPEDPNRPYNLWEPVKGDYGAQGSFSRRAAAQSWTLEAAKHGRVLLVALGLSVAALLTLVARGLLDDEG